MKLDQITKDRTGASGCPECGGVGYVLTEIVRGSRMGALLLCNCVKENCLVCPSEGRAPFLVYEEKMDKMIPCFCHEARIRLTRLEKIFEKSNIPPRYRYRFLFTMDLRNEESNTISLLAAHDWASDLIRRYKDNKEIVQGMYLWGNTGSGKTHMACAILNELIIRYGVECRYAKVNWDFLNALKDTYQKGSDLHGQERTIEKEFAEVDVLVIDDFGVQKDSDWANAKLYDLIDTRYEKQKLTLLTSNSPLTDWKEKGEGRVYSRLCEMASEIHLECPDYRERYSKNAGR